MSTERVNAKSMDYMSNGINVEERKVCHQFVQIYSLMKLMKHFGNKGKEAAMNEMKQLHSDGFDEVVHHQFEVQNVCAST